jgi:hypothetical protein
MEQFLQTKVITVAFCIAIDAMLNGIQGAKKSDVASPS